MFSHNADAVRRIAAVAIASGLMAGASLLAPPAAAQGQQPRTEVAPFQHGVHAGAGGGPTAYDEATPPLFDNLGKHTWKVTTKNPEAQAFFDQGLRLAYGFNHAEARRAFRQAQRLDPSCAMCFWGEAFVLGPKHQCSNGSCGERARTGSSGACSGSYRQCQREGAGVDLGPRQQIFG
jgi:hypothetical protein